MVVIILVPLTLRLMFLHTPYAFAHILTSLHKQSSGGGLYFPHFVKEEPGLRGLVTRHGAQICKVQSFSPGQVFIKCF